MQNQLEKYLLQIEKQLSGLSVEQSQDELREIRSHLEMMIQENVAHGCNADEAVSKALAQFGAAKKVASDLKRTCINRDQRARTLLAGVVFVMIWIYSQRFMNWLIEIPPASHIHISPHIILAIAYFASGWVAEAIVPRKVLFTVIIPFLTMSGFVILLALTVLMLPTLMGVPASMESALQTCHQILIIQLKSAGVFLFAFLGAWLRRKQVERRQQPQIMVR